MDDAVRAEASAVADLRSGVERFAVHVAKAVDKARAQLRAAQQKVQRQVEQRRSRFEQTSRALAQAQAALARCPPEARAAAEREVAKARAANENAKAFLEKARGAAAAVDRADSELRKSLAAAQTQIDSHAGASKTYLTALEVQLKAITAGNGPGRSAHALGGAAVMIGKALATGELAVEVGLTAVEKLAHVPDGTFQEAGGLINDIIETTRNIPSHPLGESDATLEFGGQDAARKSRCE